ncbi:transcriptional regulator [Herbaspirillum rubrisubalbicans]|uniref:Transcriptional regulator n=2 Tax=Herbaspirillum rubrisubalbicans TaxID=80842 RepID=A0ABX9BW96_9BURK|nr:MULTISPECIES: IclR family transcriptional regulator C-terminal domain-containing protein [Herbaspirillum]MCP1574461.1 DNA-binding IclR family transcriptional regulator [Herbaspirillum rubrisubalbicans]NQE50225.1 transcriptional regulator [Herbaspirillum rubrisubalbicans]QJQ02935.1 transcriptional regulator [Herbaspirillum rubrisubalbicans Os34]RAM62118.1 transcriptional regulator [Herbaspirillum rubrisubalbicans]RAN45225.1 transcriptional regulator [Herbaspirillum rubrisubalbicans]
MNSLSRMLDVLTLFKPSQPVIDIDIICAQLGYTPASAYRYVRELGNAGLLVKMPRGYAVGPKVIELDRHMTQFDPLLAASRDIVGDLVAQTGLELLISELYGSTVINILQESGNSDARLNYGRGTPMDLFHSATARVILAYLLPRQLRKHFDQASAEELRLVGTNWKDFSKVMLKIRKDGYCVSVGELDPGKTGIAAPIFDEKQRILGSITLAGNTERVNAFNRDFLSGLITDAASKITARIAG